MSPEEFQKVTGVSRETMDKFSLYYELLLKWQKAVNLVGKSTLDDIWARHFWDSAQLFPLIPAGCQVLVDMGSGAGFPGLVLSIMGIPETHLIESDSRKAAFLAEVARKCGLNAKVHNSRIEAVQGITADVVTARALASVAELLGYARPFLARSGGICIFPKGKQAQDELLAAQKDWVFHVKHHPSRTAADGQILILSEIAPA